MFTVEAKGKLAGGFDAIVGNPPFLGGTRISSEIGMPYFSWLTKMFQPAGHLCDQVAYFFAWLFASSDLRRVSDFSATNTVSQGDTREGGLLQIILNGGHIYSATRRYRWPGQAAVIVSVVHIVKGLQPTESVLDGSRISRISAFLLAGDVDASPTRLKHNPYFSLGSKIYGQGFIFDDHDAKSSPLSMMNELIAREPQSRSRIFPYIGGEELNSNAIFRPERFVIYLSDVDNEEELAGFPGLTEIVRERVKPERDVLGSNPNNTPLKRRWWAYQAHRPELYSSIRTFDRVLACSQVSAHMAFAFLPTGWIYSQKLCLFALKRDCDFALIQSRVHEVWARFFASTLKDDLNYTPSDCFETFPFPLELLEQTSSDAPTTAIRYPNTLESAGRIYYEFRAALMVRNNEGLTKTYNRFHDPDELSPDIIELRRLHAAMDRAVLEVYGWHDLALTAACNFLLDYEDEDEEEDTLTKGRSRKKPWRYRWPDEFRDDVLARLLELNKQRAEQERLTGEAVSAKQTGTAKAGRSKSRKSKTNSSENATLFDSMDAGGEQ